MAAFLFSYFYSRRRISDDVYLNHELTEGRIIVE